MDDNIHDLNAARHAKQGNGLQPASPQEAVALLTSCLALVRPVGMTENEAEDWLSVAVGAVIEYPAIYLREAAWQAQKSCTHHAQIVPAMVKHCEGNIPARDPFAWAAHPVALPAPEMPRLPPPKLTQQMVDAMTPELVKMGLTCGALIRDEQGNVLVNPE